MLRAVTEKVENQQGDEYIQRYLQCRYTLDIHGEHEVLGQPLNIQQTEGEPPTPPPDQPS